VQRVTSNTEMLKSI